MSGRSRGAPGRAQGRSRGAGRWKGNERQKRAEDETRDLIHTVGDARRGDVYRADVAFTGDEIPRPLPAKGTPERAEVVRQIAELKAQGMTHMAIAVATGLGQGTVALVVKEGRDG